MKIITTLLTTAIITLSATAYAGINAPYYFKEKCLADVSIENLPRRLEFTCDQKGRCFSSDMFMNIVLNCARPFEREVIQSKKIRPMLLDSKGFRKAVNIEYSYS